MRRRRHPLSGAMYVVGDDGFVHVDLGDKHGVFTADGDWVSGELHQADPHLCGWLAGPQLPAGFAGNPKDLPAVPAHGRTPPMPAGDGDGDVVRHG